MYCIPCKYVSRVAHSHFRSDAQSDHPCVGYTPPPRPLNLSMARAHMSAGMVPMKFVMASLSCGMSWGLSWYTWDFT